MKNAEIFEALNQLERRFPVRAWRSSDIDLWPTYRIRLYLNALETILRQEPAQVRSAGPREALARVGRAMLRVSHAALRDRRANARVDPGTDAVFFSDGVSFVRVGDTWFDRVVDPVAEALERYGHRSLKLTPLDHLHTPRYMPSRFIQPAIDRIKVTATYRRVPADLPDFEKLQAAARDLLGNMAPSLQWLQVQAARLHGLAGWFGRVFDRAGATHAFVNTYYSLEGQSFVQAARRRGIRSIDLQHGIQGPHHVAYAHWANLPAAGYSTLPDEFWVWSAAEAETIETWRSGCMRHVPRITGNFWQERWFDDSDPVVARYLAQARELRDSRPQVLVCGTWGVPDEEITKLIEAAKLCGSSVRWWWRLHPVLADQVDAFARRLESHGLDGSQVRQATDLPLFALLRATDINVAHSSTVIGEAAQLGVPSVVTSDYGAELHGELIQRGLALLATDETSIADAIRKLAGRERSPQAGLRDHRGLLRAVLEASFATPGAAMERQA